MAKRSATKKPAKKSADLDDDDDSDVVPIPDPKPPGNWLTSLLFRPRLLLAGALVVSAIGLFPTVWRLLPDLSEESRYKFPTRAIQIGKTPPWISSKFIDEVIEHSELPEELSVLERDLPQKIARAFEAHPWVEKASVRKLSPPGLAVDLTYLEPVALVVVRGGYFLVDARAIVLPADGLVAEDAAQFPMIVGVNTMPADDSGSVWPDPTVLGAAKLAQLLKDRWQALGLSAIRIPAGASPSAAPDDIVYELETPGGSRILWGRTPDTDHPGELTPDQKVGRLEKYAADFGGFDNAPGAYEIDIRHWQEISRRPITRPRKSAERPRIPSRRRH